jgi:hypothetical protein
MSRKTEQEKCDIGTVNYQGKCWKKKQLVKQLIDEADFDLTSQARSYLQAIDEAEAMYGIKGVDTQIAYITSNLTADTKAQELVIQQLDDILKGRSVSTIPKEKPVNEMTEVEAERIMMAFERATERKVNSLQRMIEDIESEELEETPAVKKQIEESKLTMEDFVRFSKVREIPVEKVLVATDWTEDVLAEEVIQAKKEAEKRITIKEE